METPFVERDCVITHNGHTFESGGAVITEDRAIAYCKGGENIYPHTLRTLTDWHGNPIGTYRIKSSRHTEWTVQYYINATINGRQYYGQTQGPGMIAYLKAKKGGDA